MGILKTRAQRAQAESDSVSIMNYRALTAPTLVITVTRQGMADGELQLWHALLERRGPGYSHSRAHCLFIDPSLLSHGLLSNPNVTMFPDSLFSLLRISCLYTMNYDHTTLYFLPPAPPTHSLPTWCYLKKKKKNRTITTYMLVLNYNKSALSPHMCI